MDTRGNNSRNGACNNYQWDAWSAGRKLVSGTDINIGVIKKSIPPNDPKTDAYRRCGNCQKHFNYHSKNDNNYKNKQLNPFPRKK